MRTKTKVRIVAGTLAGYMLAVAWPTLVSYAQVAAEIPYEYWAKPYAMAELASYVKGDEGEPNEDTIYLRLNWGVCLVITKAGVERFFESAPRDKPASLRAYADAQYFSNWNRWDKVKCPAAPHQVKPAWFGSRPLYWIDVVDGVPVKGDKTDYRVETDDDVGLGECHGWIERKYWSLEWEEPIYHRRTGEQTTQQMLAVDVPEEDRRWMATVCRKVPDVLPYD